MDAATADSWEEIMGSRRTHPAAGFLAVAVALTLAGRAAAVAPQIKDDGKFFSADAVKKANDDIREISRKYDKDLLVETFAGVPEAQKEKVAAMSRAERSNFVRAWARERAQANVVHGVYVLVCRSPAQLYVEVTPRGRAAIDEEARKKLIETLATNFQEQKFDEGLQAAVKFVRDRFAAALK
jgi:hypothetical protein